MNATSVVPGLEAVSQANPSTMSVDEQIDLLQKRLELFRIDATLTEFRYSRHPNDRLIAWYEGRRKVLWKQLGIQGSGAL